MNSNFPRLTLGIAAMTCAALWLGPGSGQMALMSDALSPVRVVHAGEQPCTALTVDGDEVNICRDDYGVPHIFAETNKALFQGFGYADAQDRLWQMELFRRAATGRLAEILGNLPATNLGGGGGTAALAVDRDIRTRFYNEEQLGELTEQFAMLTDEEQEIFTAYADGINRYLTEVVAVDQANRLPFEFHYLGIGVPQQWRALDVVANAIYQTRFGHVGGMESQNQTLLTSLIRRYCPDPTVVCDTAWGIFNDIRWTDDPDTPVAVPIEAIPAVTQTRPRTPRSEQIVAALADAGESLEEQANSALLSLGLPLTHGSHTWVVGPTKSANGHAMLFGGPQVSFNTPEVFHEVQLKGGNGFDVMGAAFAGVPIVHAGRTDHIAWAMTSGVFGDNRDTYLETLCSIGGIAAAGYVFNGTCLPFDTHQEIINVSGAAAVTCTVRRTVHGPVTVPACNAPWPTSNNATVLSQKRVFWRREIQSQRAKLAFNRARNLQEFKAAVEQMEAAHNILYADATGNIAYFFAGKVPIRPENCTSGDPVARCLDSRLPLPGDGSAEWTGQYRAMPVSINPARGWLSNWNSKPALGYPNPDQRSFGKQYRSLEIDQRLAQPGLLSFDDMKDIAKDIARTGEGGDGREARYIKPFLLSALRSAPPTHPLTAEAVGILERWDGTLFDDAVSSQYLAPGQVIFSTWLRGRPEVAPCAAKSFPGVLCYVFGDEVPNFNPNNTSGLNMLIHVLDDALGGGSRVLPSRNYFDGCDSTVFGACRADVIMSTAFEKALDALGPEPAWSSHPRETTHFQHTLSQAIPEIASVLDANRASYGFVVVFERPKPIAESIVSLGQSGFIGLAAPGTPVFDVHFADQLELFRAFGYRPMRLFDNARSTK